jgi:hypothetical protein
VDDLASPESRRLTQGSMVLLQVVGRDDLASLRPDPWLATVAQVEIESNNLKRESTLPYFSFNS